MAEWAGVVNTTTAKFLKGFQDNTLRTRKVVAMLQKKGRLNFNAGGTECQFQVKFKRPPVESYGDAGQLTFNRIDKFRKLVLDWRGYVATDMMTNKEKLMNKGPQALIDRYATITPDLVTSMEEEFSNEFYVDGNAAGNANRMHGFESFCGAGTTTAADKVAQPSDVYGGKATTLQNQGGSWSALLATKPNAAVATDWPDGQGTADYDYLAPKLVNWSSTAWGTGSTAWIDNSERAIRQAIIWTTLTNGPDGMIDVFLLSSGLYNDYLNRVSSMQRIQVDTNSTLRQLGFRDTINQDGVDLTPDFGVAPNTGYGWNFDKVDLDCLDSQLFVPQGPEYSIRDQAWLFAVGFFGNLRFNPKFFSKLFNYA